MDSSPTPDLLDRGFLRDGGDMGRRIRAFPWQDTPLGPPEHWSLQARTAVRLLLTTNHPVFLFLGPELTCLYNDAYSRSLGPEKHPGILGGRARDCWQEIWHIIGPQLDQVMSGHGSTWQENQLVPITRHGGLQDVYWTYSYSPIDDPAAPNGVGGVLVLCTETTQQVLAAERMRAAERRWRELFDQAPGFMCVLSGPDHVFEYANPGYLELVGGVADIVGRPVAAVLPWAEEQGFLPALDQVFRSGETFNARTARLVIPARDEAPEQVRYLDFVYQPIRDESGRVTGIFVLGSDVTDRSHAQLALSRSEEQRRMACDAADLGIHDYDMVTGGIAWDRRVRALWGVGEDEPVTMDTFLAGIHPDDRAATKAAVERASAPDGDHRYFAEYRVIHRGDGMTRWVQATGRVFFNGRVPQRLVGTAMDISERKQADVRRHEFLATLGHELRNPLAPIATSLQVLRRRAPGDESVQQAHAVIDRQLKQMVRLLEDLLDVVRVTNGRIELRCEPQSLHEVLRAALETAAPHVQRGGHSIAVATPGTPVRVHADPIRLAQVFSNLLINACKYSERGSRIDVVTETGPGEVAVRIRDHGVGIPAAQLSRVFEMFSQAEPSLHRSQGGLGIGLSLARGLVELHGGTISVHSDGPGQGSEFVVRLPTLEPSADKGATPPLAVAPALPFAGRRMLVVDDNVDAATSLSQLLVADGAITQVANDGPAALEVADTFLPDAVLLDIGLPGMNGYEVCEALRRRSWASRLRIVALTGWGQASDRELARQAGFDQHLVKPVDYRELLDALASPRT